jgi:hypothetical protein
LPRNRASWVAWPSSCSRSGSRTTIRFFGTIIFVAGLVTPLIGVERACAMVEWTG